RPVYYGLNFVLRMPTWVVMAVYLVQELHFSPLQLVLMGTVMEAAVFLCEIPTGVVADTYSRRLSLIVGYLGTGVAWLLVGVAPGRRDPRRRFHDRLRARGHPAHAGDRFPPAPAG